jgi:hypothetical protein
MGMPYFLLSLKIDISPHKNNFSEQAIDYAFSLGNSLIEIRVI